MDSSILEEKFISNGMRKFKKKESIFGRGGNLISGTALRIRVISPRFSRTRFVLHKWLVNIHLRRLHDDYHNSFLSFHSSHTQRVDKLSVDSFFFSRKKQHDLF